jgi:hypothetical protein
MHQKGETTAVQANQKGGKKDYQTALLGGQTSASLTAALFSCPLSEWDPQYSSQKQALFETEGGNSISDRWWKFTDGHIIIPESLAPTFVKQFQDGNHLGQIALETTLAQHFYAPKLSSISKTIFEIWTLCARNNPRQGPRWKYLLVFAPSQDGWKPSPLRLRKPKKWSGS